MMKDNNNLVPIPLFSKMIDDLTKVRQPENSYTYALNATVRENILQREGGFDLQQMLPEGFILISSSRIRDNKRVCFSTNGELSQIGIYDGEAYIESVTAKLNFQLTSKIDCTYRLRNGCEDCIYFTDYLNPIRYFNFSRPSNFKTNGNWNVNKFSLIRNAKFPKIHNIKITDSGTQIQAGAVIYGIRYLDDDLNPTHFIYTTHSILLFKGNGSPSISYETQYIGKTVSFDISNLDTDFKYYQIAAAYINSGTGEINQVKLTDKININNKKFVHNAATIFIESSLTELTAFKTPVHTALTVDQIDNQLIISNIKENSIDAAAHQKFASRVGVGVAVKPVLKNAVDNPAHPENPNYLEFASHMANEVVALAITYVDSTTGIESGPYHIPGRPLDRDPYYCDEIDIINNQEKIKLNCVSVRILSKSTPTSLIKITYIVAENGIGLELDANLIDIYNVEDEFVEYNKCVTFPKIIQILGVVWVDTNTPVSKELYEIAYYQQEIDSNTSGITLDGWDSTVYTTGERDVVALGEQYSYNEVLHAYFAFYGSNVALSNEKLNRVDFKTYFKNKILEGVYTYPLKWEIYNTAKVVNDGKIIMGYYETKNSFYENPLHSSCLNEDFWGYDICGQPLTGKRIRHHRLPDRNLVPINDNTNLYLIGLEFFNIDYPEGYDSHYFSCAVKTEDDKTVLDNGIITRLSKFKIGLPLLYQTNLPDETTVASAYIYNYFKIDAITNNNGVIKDFLKDEDDCGYFSPLSLSNQLIAQGYLKYNYGYKNIPQELSSQRLTVPGHKIEWQEVSNLYGADDAEVVWFKASLENDIFQITPSDFPKNLPIKRSFNIPVNNYEYDTVDSTKMVNLSLANRLVILKGLERYLFEHRNIGYASIMLNRDVYSNLDTISYRRLHLNNLTKTESQIIFGGDTYICKFNLVNYAQYSYKGDSVGKIVAAFSAALSAAISGLSTGNPLVAAGIGTASLIAGITQAGSQNALENARNNKYEIFVRHGLAHLFGGAGIDGAIKFMGEVLENAYIDSYINWNLRYDGNDEATMVLRTNTTAAITQHFYNKFLTPAKTDEEKDNAPKSGMVLRTMIAPETYFFYKDFNPVLNAKRYYGIPSTYNFCSNCRELYPNRVYYSLQSFQEELTDNYRQILPNNYKDVQSEFGEILDIFRMNNQLFISLKETLLEQPRNYQERITDQLVTFIGTGEFLEIPAREVVSSDIGKLGNTNKEATVVVPEGALIVDELNLKIYLIRLDSKNPIINLASEEYGYKETLERIIPIKLNKYFPDIDIKTNSHYCGYLCTYDEVEKRFLITKKDYVPKFKQIVYASSQFIYQDKKFSKIIDINDTEYFYNISWTLSYSIINDGLISFHSYIPDNYLPFKDSLHLQLKDNKFWKAHSKEIYSNYFGEQYPHIIEFCINNQFIKHLYNLIRVSLNTVVWNKEAQDFKHSNKYMFNKMLVYNERQCSGYIELDLKDEYDEQDKTFYRTDSVNINYFRDISNPDSEVPLFIKNNSVDFRFSNKLLNELSLRQSPNWNEEYYFKGKYLVIRLIIDNFEAIKFETDISTIYQLPFLKF